MEANSLIQKQLNIVSTHLKDAVITEQMYIPVMPAAAGDILLKPVLLKK